MGDMHIGNNVSEFAWDGTDQFGDRLANGVYFYKVDVRKNGEPMELRETVGDKYFKERMGKIYLMK
jgi:flagellar hook assembly protein FlgD